MTDHLKALDEAVRVARVAARHRMDAAAEQAVRALIVVAEASLALARSHAQEIEALRSQIRTASMIGHHDE